MKTLAKKLYAEIDVKYLGNDAYQIINEIIDDIHIIPGITAIVGQKYKAILCFYELAIDYKGNEDRTVEIIELEEIEEL